jgi:hypothetical protein
MIKRNDFPNYDILDSAADSHLFFHFFSSSILGSTFLEMFKYLPNTERQ